MNSELLIILNLCLTFVVFGVSGSCDLGTYGRNCEKNCSQYCASDIDEYVHCDQWTGRCSEGCVPGWYGGTCNIPCSSHCNNRTCSQQTGSCTLGCTENHTGDDCETENEIEKRTELAATTRAIIAVIAIAILAAIAIIVAVIYRRRKRSFAHHGTRS
ncbi:multiple epidermal growth factor-like domains protein 10 isoform X2 [Haliotis rufescens]|uniref:multiple epidermal growth factor-like domains protein 10 isoform X2 n=1 Tax=Haliotis rufescens TaxID=6454 RepID=UPI00201E859E|nr:multiple epidermal growth factor-like domains protein 10 isoform X2 [Haliotis rufescens]